MRKLSPYMLQAIVFLGVYVVSKALFKVLLGGVLHLIGWSELPTLQFLAENEAGLQVVSISVALAFVGLVSSRDSAQVRFSFSGYLPPLESERALYWFTIGFLCASALVTLSTLVGLTQIEAPDSEPLRLLWLFPWLVFQGVYLLLWIAALEYVRVFLARALTASAFPAVLTGLFVIVFEAHLFFSLAQAHQAQRLSWVGLVLCVLFSAALNLSYLAAQRAAAIREEFFYVRIFFLWGLALTLLNIFGQSIATWRATSLLQLYPGPLGFEPLYLYAALAVLVANTALHRLLRRSHP